MRLKSLSPADIHISPNGTVRSLTYEDIYYAPKHGIDEGKYVFLQGCNIPKKTHTPHTVLELGFGTGLNFLLTLHAFAHTPHNLHFISIEKHPIQKSDLQYIYSFLPLYLKPYADTVLSAYPDLKQGIYELDICGAKLTLYFDDVKQSIPVITTPINSVYLDGFAPSKNTDMWTKNIFSHIYKICTPCARISTFSASSTIQKSLKDLGFFVHKRTGFKRKRESIIATKNLWVPPPLQSNTPICVIGAGVMGTAIAHHLANLGYMIDVFDTHPAPLMGASGNPYAMLLPKFNKNMPFHKHAYTYACTYYTQIDCVVGNGIIAHKPAIPDTSMYIDMGEVQGDTFYFKNTGAVDTQKYADAVYAHPNITYIQKTMQTIPEKYQLCIVCLGADTNTLLANPVPYTINRGSVAIINTNSQILPPIPTYHKGYAFEHNNIGICGATFERIGDWTPHIPDINIKTHTKYLADKMCFFNIDLHNTPHKIRTGLRANAKKHAPVIHQQSDKTFYIYAIGARGYINAPYTASLFCTYVLNHKHHPHLQDLFESMYI